MGVRYGVALVFAVVAGAAMAAIAGGQEPPAYPGTTTVPSNERTDPQVNPTFGSALTVFTLTFTLRDAPGHEGAMATEYRAQVTAPPGSRSSCMAAQPPAIDSGTAGATERIALPPPAGGWCRGTYLVTVFLQRGPYCPKPVEGQPPTACPEFATQELDTGSTSFTRRLRRARGFRAEPQGAEAGRRGPPLEAASSQGALHRAQQPVRRHPAPRADHPAEACRGREGAAGLNGACPDQLRT